MDDTRLTKVEFVADEAREKADDALWIAKAAATLGFAAILMGLIAMFVR